MCLCVNVWVWERGRRSSFLTEASLYALFEEGRSLRPYFKTRWIFYFAVRRISVQPEPRFLLCSLRAGKINIFLFISSLNDNIACPSKQLYNMYTQKCQIHICLYSKYFLKYILDVWNMVLKDSCWSDGKGRCFTTHTAVTFQSPSPGAWQDVIYCVYFRVFFFTSIYSCHTPPHFKMNLLLCKIMQIC